MTNVIKLFGAMWCADCIRAKKFFVKHNIDYKFHDTDKEPRAKEIMMQINNSIPSIPTIVFPDGSYLIEPSNQELAEKLKVKN